MSFNDYEQSRAQGRPAELLEIRYGNDADDIVRFTRHDHDLTLGGNQYQSITIERDGFDDDGDPDDSQQLNFKLPYDNPFAEVYRGRDFATAITLKLRAVHLSDPDLQITALWSGRLTGVNWERPWMIIGGERMSTSLKRSGLTSRYSIGRCVHVQYQGGCALNRADWAVPAVVDTITNGRTLSVPVAASQPNGRYRGGILEHQGVMRWILSHVGDVLVLSGPLREMTEGAAVTLYPSCHQLRATCHQVFNNRINYLAFDWMPRIKPYSGGSVI